MGKKSIENKLPLLFDGAMGTYYNMTTDMTFPDCEMANLFNRKGVLEIHREYVEAGAKAIKTNTFGANTIALNTSPHMIENIIKTSVEIAREAIGDRDIELFADIGPIPKEENFSCLDEYKKIVDIFIDLKVDNFLFETFPDTENLDEISKYIKGINEDAFIITNFAISPEGETYRGEKGIDLLEFASKVEEIDAMGFNCISGPHHIKKYLETVKLPKKLIAIMPNAGYPTNIKERTYYNANSGYFSNELMEILSLGASIIGGCCGTTPEHIEKLNEKMSIYVPHEVSIEPKKKFRLTSTPTENLFLKKIESGEKPIAVEYEPPLNLDMKKYMKNSKRLMNAGADAITIADCPVGRARIDASLTAYKLKNEIGIDAIVHIACRDRNINATKAILLGLNVENILNIIVVTGDPIQRAERDKVKAVFSFNSRNLAEYVSNLNEDIFENKMNIGAALNINARNFNSELEKSKMKKANGVNIFFTQPALSEKSIENLKEAKKVLGKYIMGGIIPVVSYKNAVYMNAEVSGINVSDEIIALYENKERDEATKLAIDISLDYMNKIKDMVDGFYIITPLGRIDIVEEIIKQYRA